MFFGGDYLGFDDALFAAARLLEIVSRAAVRPRGAARRPAHAPSPRPRSGSTCPKSEKFELVERAAAHFSARYPVNTIDGVRITFPDGWGLLRASNTQPILVLRFEASDPAVAGRRPRRGRRLARGAGRAGLAPCRGAAAGSPRSSRASSSCCSRADGRAALLADRWWAAEVSPAAVGVPHRLAPPPLACSTLAGVVVAAAWFIGHLLVVYRAVGSVQVRRNVANLEFREALTPGALLAVVVGRGRGARARGRARDVGRAPPQVALGWQGVTYGVSRAAAAARPRPLRRAAAALARRRTTSRSSSSCSASALVFGAVPPRRRHPLDRTAGPPSTATRAPISAGCSSALALTLMWGYLLEPFELVAGLDGTARPGALARDHLHGAAAGRRGARDGAALGHLGGARRGTRWRRPAGSCCRSPRSSGTGWCRRRWAARASRSPSGARWSSSSGSAYGLEALSGEPAPRRPAAATPPVVPVALEPAMATRLLAADSVDVVSLDPALLAVGGHGRGRCGWRRARCPAGASSWPRWRTTAPGRAGEALFYRPQDSLPQPLVVPLAGLGRRAFHAGRARYRIGRATRAGVALDSWPRRRAARVGAPGAGAARAA